MDLRGHLLRDLELKEPLVGENQQVDQWRSWWTALEVEELPNLGRQFLDNLYLQDCGLAAAESGPSG